MAEPALFQQFQFGLIKPLELVSVEARGIPGQERIYLKTHKRLNLREYLLLLGVYQPNNSVIPATDHSLWLGHYTLDPGCWVIVYTGPGSNVFTRIRNTNEPALVIYWGKSTTILDDNRVVPCLIHMDMTGIQIGRPPYSQ